MNPSEYLTVFFKTFRAIVNKTEERADFCVGIKISMFGRDVASNLIGANIGGRSQIAVKIV